jgi:undecaprenyl diphosphate synthase
MKIRYRREGGVVLCWFGDGAIHQGSFHESLNMAKIWNLPIVYICENNQYGMGTDFRRVSSVTDFVVMGDSYGIPGKQVNGMDVEEVYQEVGEAAEKARGESTPVFLEIKTYRYRGHSMSDPAKYRTPEELESLMDLYDRALRDIAVDERVHRHQIRVQVIGNRALLPARVQDAIDVAEKATAHYTRYRFNVALAYGGRDEIVEAIRALAREVRDGRIAPEEIDSAAVSRHLYTADLPDPDLIFRTSGEERISNFLLWQAAYSELYFSDVMWPGLTRLEFLRAIRSFQMRRRRFGE